MCDVMGRYYANISGDEVTGILEEPKMHFFPGGLVVSSQLIQCKPKSHAQVQILIHNMSKHPVTLQSRRVIAECSLVDRVKPIRINDDDPLIKAQMFTVKPTEGSPTEELVDLNFEDSPISEQFKKHITEGISKEAASAFAKNDLDIGQILIRKDLERSPSSWDHRGVKFPICISSGSIEKVKW